VRQAAPPLPATFRAEGAVRKPSSPVSGSKHRRAREREGRAQPAQLSGRGLGVPGQRPRAAQATGLPMPRGQTPQRYPPQRSPASEEQENETSTRFQPTKVSGVLLLRACPNRRSDGAHSPSAGGTEAPAPGPRPRRITSGETESNAGLIRWFRMRQGDGRRWISISITVEACERIEATLGLEPLSPAPGSHFRCNLRCMDVDGHVLPCNRETQRRGLKEA
jgi:hypothetical protein